MFASVIILIKIQRTYKVQPYKVMVSFAGVEFYCETSWIFR